MSVSSALSSALSGLVATSRQAEVISSNVANATTPGYAPREVALSARQIGQSGQGVMVRGVERNVDAFLLGDRRSAQASAGERDTRTAFLSFMEGVLGGPDNPGSLTARINALDTALLQAASRPESEARLAAAVGAARFLAQGLNEASAAVQDERAATDRKIGSAVELLNASLREVQDLNTKIRSFTGAGHDISALLDQRQMVIDRIADLVPLKEVPRDHNQVALMTAGGAVLLDGPAAEFGFTSVRTIVPEMTVQSGGLSGLTLNGRPMATAGESSLVLGGRLAAMFALRDEAAVSAQRHLDALSRDLVERFSASGLDPSLPPGAPGLFTDAGAAFQPSDEVGLAQRIALNAAVDPQQGGELFRLRDGLGATSPGPTGDASLLTGLSKALTAARPLSSAGFLAGTRSLPALAADILSVISTNRLSAETEKSFSLGQLAALQDMEAARGVDVDEEMQNLLVVEKNYAANAKVIQTVDDMLDRLLGL